MNKGRYELLKETGARYRIKVYSDKTMQGWSKEKLIERIRCLENNYINAMEFNKHQTENFEGLFDGLMGIESGE